jgi:hypothetical protein
VAAAPLGLAAVLLFVLRELPYSSVRFSAVDSEETRRPPTPDFHLGPLTWSVTSLRHDPALRAFRSAMRASCGDRKGVAAAACASHVLRDRVPTGNPSSEYVNVEFDPVTHFERHMAGEPGHCLTRSAILTSQLLSVGIPARVLQMVPANGSGHTLVEAWDDALGWVVVDPSTDGYLVATRGSATAVDLLGDPDGVVWKGFGPVAASATETEAKRRYFKGLLTGNLLYPEPWLYLRVGPRVGPWPTRGQYARVGPTRLTLGPLQQALFFAIPVLGLASAAFVLGGSRRPNPLRTMVWVEPQRSPRSVDDLDALPPG